MRERRAARVRTLLGILALALLLLLVTIIFKLSDREVQSILERQRAERYTLQLETPEMKGFNVEGEKVWDIQADRGFHHGLDTDQVILFAQKFCYEICKIQSYKDIKLFIGLVPDDGKYAQWRNRFHGIGLSNQLWSALIDSMIKRVGNNRLKCIDRQIQFPLYWKGIDKEYAVAMMPKDILDHVWVCRKSNQDIQCGTCLSCLAFNKALTMRGNDNARDVQSGT